MVSVYLDANVLISAFESTSATNEHVWRVLKAIETGEIKGVTSQLTLVELLPIPLAKGQFELVQVYEDLLSSQGVLDVQPVTPETLIAAARLRAGRLSIKTPDAIHLATARRAGCVAVLTNDQRLNTPAGPVIVEPAPDCLERIEALSQ